MTVVSLIHGCVSACCCLLEGFAELRSALFVSSGGSGGGGFHFFSNRDFLWRFWRLICYDIATILTRGWGYLLFFYLSSGFSIDLSFARAVCAGALHQWRRASVCGGFTMEFTYFKTDTSSPVRLLWTPDGRIDFEELGREFKLDPTTIKLNESLFPKIGLKSASKWEQIKAVFEKEGEPLGTKEDAVIVTGEVAVRAWSTAEETSGKKQKKSAEFELGDRKEMGFEAKDCDITKWEVGTLVPTDGMQNVMMSFGGFPAKFYVRQEEVSVFQTIQSLLTKRQSRKEPEKFALVGSPGVGKSVFLVYFAFYMARNKSRNVLCLRRLKERTGSLVCVFLTQDHYYEVPVLDYSRVTVALWELNRQFRGFLYFVDGFSPKEVTEILCLGSYSLLATSSQFSLKSDDPTDLVLLPAWKFSDLKEYSDKTEMFKAGDNAKEYSAEDLYEYSGGSLREFCRDLDDLKVRVTGTLEEIGNTNDIVTLMGPHGGVSETQVDRLRRRYLDPKGGSWEQYRGTKNKFVVDSSYVLRGLLLRCDRKQYEDVYSFAEACGGAFYGWAFEMYLHKLATSGGFTIRVKEYGIADGQYEQYVIKCSNPTTKGTNKEECKDSLISWASDASSKYWYPEYSQFPSIDSVAKMVCTSTGENVLAYLQFTVADTHSLDGKWMDRLDEVLKGDQRRMYIAIQPQIVVSERKITLLLKSKPHRVKLYEAFF